MDDILASIRGHINERLNSPLFGAYSLAWMFFNYKVPLLLFSSLDVHQKMFQIDSYLHADFHRVLVTYGWPLVIAAFYIFILPIPSTLVSAWTLFHQNYLATVQQRVLKRRIVTEEEMAEREQKWRTALEEREKQFQELEMLTESLRTHRKRAESDLSDVTAQLKDTIEKSNEIPGLEGRLAEADAAVKSMASERAESNQKLQVLNDEITRTGDILKEFAEVAENRGAHSQMSKILHEVIADKSTLPVPIQFLLVFLSDTSSPEAVVSGNTAQNPVSMTESAEHYFDFNKGGGYMAQYKISNADLLRFLGTFRDKINSSVVIDQDIINKTADYISGLSDKNIGRVLSVMRQNPIDFSKLPDPIATDIARIIKY